MTYTAIAMVAVLAALALDRWVARTRLTTTVAWWTAYGIIVFFQLLTNGWLTGRGIVRYDPEARSSAPAACGSSATAGSPTRPWRTWRSASPSC